MTNVWLDVMALLPSTTLAEVSSALRGRDEGAVWYNRLVGSPLRICAASCLAGLAALALSACGGPARPASLGTALSRALALLDRTSSVHLAYSVTGKPPAAGTEVTGGEGDLERPGSFNGAFQVSESGLPITIGLVVSGDVVYLKLPFGRYEKVNLSKYGFPNPVALFSPSAGLTAVFRRTSSLVYDGTVAKAGTVLWSISGYVPGPPLSRVLQLGRLRSPVKVDYGISPSSGRLVTVTMTGPFYRAGQQNQVLITLSKYGERPAIKAPAA
jgi:hypothetical protein